MPFNPDEYRLFVRRDAFNTINSTLPSIQVNPSEHMNYRGEMKWTNSGYLSLFEYLPNTPSDNSASRAMNDSNISGAYIHFLFIPKSVQEVDLTQGSEEGDGTVYITPKTGRTPTLFNTCECNPPSKWSLDGKILEYANRYIKEHLYTGSWAQGTIILTVQDNSKLLTYMRQNMSVADMFRALKLEELEEDLQILDRNGLLNEENLEIANFLGHIDKHSVKSMEDFCELITRDKNPEPRELKQYAELLRVAQLLNGKSWDNISNIYVLIRPSSDLSLLEKKYVKINEVVLSIEKLLHDTKCQNVEILINKITQESKFEEDKQTLKNNRLGDEQHVAIAKFLSILEIVPMETIQRYCTKQKPRDLIEEHFYTTILALQELGSKLLPTKDTRVPEDIKAVCNLTRGPAYDMDLLRDKCQWIRAIILLEQKKQQTVDSVPDRMMASGSQFGTHKSNKRTAEEAFSLQQDKENTNLPHEGSTSSQSGKKKEEDIREKLFKSSNDEKVKRELSDETKGLKGYILGDALGKGDCFFDACAQALATMGKMQANAQPYDVKSLRQLCYDYVLELDRQMQDGKITKEGNWIYQECKSDGAYYDYLKTIRFTAEEAGQPGNNILTSGLATWGRVSVDGRIICEKLGIDIHWVEILDKPDSEAVNTKILHQLQQPHAKTHSLGGQHEINYQDEKTIHLVVHKSHVVPLLKSSALSESNTIKSSIDTTENLSMLEQLSSNSKKNANKKKN